MKKAIIALFVLLVSAGFVYAAKKTKTIKKPGPIIITSALQVIEELEKRGITGIEAEMGIVPKAFRVLSLRDYRGIVNHNYSVAVWDYRNAAGFNIAVKLFQMLTFLSDTEVYKRRPFIISVEFEDKAEFDRILAKLKEFLPDIKEIGAKEY